jgi:predicted HicB family RNase H-like nuclease
MSKKKINKQIVTSLRVNPELWKLAKIEAIKRGITLADVVESSLKKELKIEKLEGC